MAGKIIVSTLQSDTDNSISFVANTGATIFSANISHGIAGSFIADGSITASKIADGAIVATEIADGAVTGPKLGANAINANNIVNATITGDKIGLNAISQNNIVSVNASVATVGTLPKARLPTGTVLQVVQTVKSDTFSSTSTSFTDITGLSVSITPISASNKILVIYSVMTGASSSGPTNIRLVRNSTAIAIGDSAGSRTQVTTAVFATNSNNQSDVQNMNFLDSPATTSSTTYKLQIQSDNGSTQCVNRNVRDDNASYESRGVSTITVMEIAA
jgi:hypothetical protein